MKKIFFCLILFISIQAFSQISVGVTGGFIAPLQNYPDSSLTSNTAYKIGAEIILGLNTHWKIRTDIEYISFVFSNYIRAPYYTRNIFHAQYLNIPIGIRYVFNGTKLRPFVDGSISFMSNIGHTNSSSQLYSNSSSLPFTSNYTPNSFVLSPALYAGVLCNPSDKIYLSFMMGYAMQTSHIYKVPNNKHDITNIRCNGLSGVLSIGYILK